MAHTNSSHLLAEILDELEKDGYVSPAKYLAEHPEYGELADAITVALALRHLPAVEPSLAFQQGAKKRLLAKLAARPDLTPPPTVVAVKPRFSVGQWLRQSLAPDRLAFSFVLFVLIIGLGAVGLRGTVNKSLPGDRLYTLKLGLEQARLLLSRPETTQIETHLALADQRISEVQLALLNQVNEADVQEAVQNYAWHLVAAYSSLSFLPPAEQANQSFTLHERLMAQQWAWVQVRGTAPAGIKLIIQTAITITQEQIAQLEKEIVAAIEDPTEHANQCLAFASQNLETAIALADSGQPELAAGPS